MKNKTISPILAWCIIVWVLGLAPFLILLNDTLMPTWIAIVGYIAAPIWVPIFIVVAIGSIGVMLAG